MTNFNAYRQKKAPCRDSALLLSTASSCCLANTDFFNSAVSDCNLAKFSVELYIRLLIIGQPFRALSSSSFPGLTGAGDGEEDGDGDVTGETGPNLFPTFACLRDVLFSVGDVDRGGVEEVGCLLPDASRG